MDSFARLIIKLDIAVNKAAAAGITSAKKTAAADAGDADGTGNTAKNNGKGKKKQSPLSLKIKLLYLLLSGVSRSSDIITELCLKRSNLAILIKELISEKLISKRQSNSDKRIIILSPTQKGIDFFEKNIAGLTEASASAFGSGCDEAAQKLEEAVQILEFL